MVTAKIDFLDLLKVADSGQAFRIRVIDDAHVELVAFGRYLQIADLGKDTFAFSCDEIEFEDIWKPYLDLGRDYGRIVKSINKNDEYLSKIDFSGIADETNRKPGILSFHAKTNPNNILLVGSDDIRSKTMVFKSKYTPATPKKPVMVFKTKSKV